VPGAPDALVDAGCQRLPALDPRMPVHGAAVGRAGATVAAGAAVAARTRWPGGGRRVHQRVPPAGRGRATANTVPDLDGVVDRAVATRDVHAITFVEVARGRTSGGAPDALAAGGRGTRLLRPA